MDELMTRVLKHKHPGNLLGENNVVPVGWFSIVESTITQLRALHPGLFVGAVLIDRGLLHLDAGFETAEYDVDILDQVQDITSAARTLSAWTCVKDGRPGWLVQGRARLTVLCSACQADQGLRVMRHEA